MDKVQLFRAGPRQRQVLVLLANGFTDCQIASELGISVSTVRTHLDRLYRDNGCGNRTEAVVAWLASVTPEGDAATVFRKAK